MLDQGACAAVVNRGCSLLASGILEVRGNFGIGDAVHCLDEQGKGVAAGLINYSAADVDRGVARLLPSRSLGLSTADRPRQRAHIAIASAGCATTRQPTGTVRGPVETAEFYLGHFYRSRMAKDLYQTLAPVARARLPYAQFML